MSFSLTIKSSQLRNSLCKCTPLRNKLDSFSSSSSASQAVQENEKRKKEHIYSQRWKHLNVDSTSRYLLEQVIYNKDGIVAINKPPGLGSSKQDISMNNSLPYLAEELGYKCLKLVKVPEKSISGVCILAADTVVAERVKKAVNRSKSVYSGNPQQTFLALTIGHPISREGSGKFAVKGQYHDKQKHSFIARSWSENERKRRDVNVGVISHKVVAQSDVASLVAVSTWQEHEHCPRLFLSDILLCAALGDQQFGSRVGSLFGNPILLKPWLAPAVKALPPPILKSLHLQSGSEGLIPNHFHLHELTLHGLKKDKSDLILRAEPPAFFQWSCKQLNLELPANYGIDEPLQTFDGTAEKNPDDNKIICN